MSVNTNPIGVFDSGVGGLTVLKALNKALPHEDFIYLGDTANLPYGTKSEEQVAGFVMQATRWFLRQNIKLLVIACGTATAMALVMLQKNMPELPCVGVIEPSAREAAAVSATGHIAVISTQRTADSGAYATAIKRHRDDVDVQLLGCNRLVTMVEEGRCDGPEVEAAIGDYLAELKPDYDTLVLGCTHFPLLANAIRKLLKPDVRMIDGATSTVEVAKQYLVTHKRENAITHTGTNQFFATSDRVRFGLLAQRFMNLDHMPVITHAMLSD